MTAIDELRRSIEDRLGQIENETTALRRALDALGGPMTTAPARKPPPTAAPAAVKPPATTAAAAPPAQRGPRAVVPAEKLAALLAETGEGSSTSELVDQTGGDRDQILTLLRELEQTGQVRRSGARRGTRWHAITDEDRVAKRAAELEAQQSAFEESVSDTVGAEATAAG